jgi:hypothetical protein
MKEREHLDDTGVHGKVILRRILKILNWLARFGLCAPGEGQLKGCCECDNEHPDLIQWGKISE